MGTEFLGRRGVLIRRGLLYFRRGPDIYSSLGVEKWS